MNRRQFVRASVGSIGMTAGLRGPGWADEGRAADGTADVPGAGGEVLYNGIRLPPDWPPPQLTPLPTRRGELPRDPPDLPFYLESPPAVIPIDVGRQLFVDDFLIAETTLIRTFHQARFHPACPVLRPDRPWEGSVAMPFSDGVWFDPEDGLFKLGYFGAGSPPGVCYATSTDGLHDRSTGPAMYEKTRSKPRPISRRNSTSFSTGSAQTLPRWRSIAAMTWSARLGIAPRRGRRRNTPPAARRRRLRCRPGLRTAARGTGAGPWHRRAGRTPPGADCPVSSEANPPGRAGDLRSRDRSSGIGPRSPTVD